MNKRLVSLDSCAILHLLTQELPWYPHIKPIYDDAFAGIVQIIVSEISIAECLRLETQSGKAISVQQSVQIINTFFHAPFITRRGVTSRESEFAGRLIQQHGIGTCDALIAATAVFAGAEILYTTDGCTKRRKAGKLLNVTVVQTDCGKTMQVRPPGPQQPAPPAAQPLPLFIPKRKITELKPPSN